MKRTKLEETFDLPPMDRVRSDAEEIIEEQTGMSLSKIQETLSNADKIDRALPQVSGLDNADAEYDEYARKAIEAFDDLMDLGKSVEDRLAAEIFNAASGMMNNALNAKTNKAQKKLEMVKLQLQKAKLEHEQDKLAYHKERYLSRTPVDGPVETEGQIIATRDDIIRGLLAEMEEKGNVS